MKEKDQPPKQEMTHVPWVAAWWEETVPFDKVLNHFLNRNRVAMEDTVQTAQCNASDLWSDSAKATKRKAAQCNPSQRLVEIDDNMRTRARSNASYAGQGSRKAWGAQQGLVRQVVKVKGTVLTFKLLIIK